MNTRTPIQILIFSAVFLGIVVGFGGGYIFGKGSSKDAAGVVNFTEFEKVFSKKPTFELLQEGVKVIRSKYVASSEITEENLIYGAMEGMLKSLGDPYSVFFPPKEAKIFEENVQGSFDGIGAEIGMRNEVLTVISPLKDSPAEHAGLRAGDKIITIDTKETKSLTLDKAVQMIRGQKGSKVTLKVGREGVKNEIEVVIVRDTIKIPNLKFEKKKDDIAYIALYQFTESASKDFEDAVGEILQSGAKRIILDLRNNPGGYLDVSVDIAGWFLKQNELVVTEDHRGKGANRTYTTHGTGVLEGYPLVILINKGSASASEILAGALRDQRDIKLIGEKSFGKGSVQELTSLFDRSSIKITIAKWLTPKGISIEDNGLTPDVSIDMSEDEFDKNGDIQLAKAIEVVKGL